MGPRPHHLALVQDDYLVSLADGADPLGDDHDGGAGRVPGQGGTQGGVGPVVEG